MERIKELSNKLLFTSVSNAPLVVFRIFFGAVLLYSTWRTAEEGWIKELYIDPAYHFSFFSWIKPLEGQGMYYVFLIMGIAALCIMGGFLYRISSFIFFSLFLYVELLDKTYYLNHYYLVTLICFWLMLVPAHRRYSVDALIFPHIRRNTCSSWHINIFKFQLSVVYFFAGLAKVNPDWLYRAQPMATWLPGKYQLPIIGPLMGFKEVAFLFSWAGCLYDLTIWLFLLIKKTRGIAYFFVIVFHVLTSILFPRIGMFPFIMIFSTIIFFSAEWHEKLLSFFPFSNRVTGKTDSSESPLSRKYMVRNVLVLYMCIQLFLPLRYLQYPGNLFWHEKGYRFSWRVMLMEKNGYSDFIIRNTETGVQREVESSMYLTPFQEQQMRSQPDMLLQFARYIGEKFEHEHNVVPEVYVDSRMSLNGRRSQVYVDKSVDLYNNRKGPESEWMFRLK